jgi:TRAP transporter TAXI family solute receptor
MKARLPGLLLIAIMAFAAPVSNAGAADPNWPASLTVVTASPGGTYHVYGQALAGILTSVLNLPVSERTTEGPNQNIQLIEANEAQIGFVTLGAALQAWNGSGDWTNGKSYRTIRAIFPMYDTPFHFIVLKDSAIRSLADVAGKPIGVGPQGGTAGSYMPQFLTTLNIAAPLVHGSWEELASQLENGTIAMIAAAAGAPLPAIADLERKKKVRFVPLGEDEVVRLRLTIPELTPSEIPAGTYPSLMKGYATVGLYNFAVVHKDLPDGLVYQIVEAVYDYHDKMVEAHPAAAATVPGNFVHNTFLPYHPGASRYYSVNMVQGVLRGD